MMTLSWTGPATFITIAGQSIGMGHLSRCRLLHAVLAPAHEVTLIVFCDDSTRDIIQSKDKTTICLPLTALSPTDFSTSVQDYITMDHVVIVDLVHTCLFTDTYDPSFLFQELRHQAKTIIAIDALGTQTIANRIPDVQIDALIVPYVTGKAESELIQRVGKTQFIGSKYALLPAGYNDLEKRDISQNVSSLLITCGGSDPYQHSLICLEALKLLQPSLNVRIVVGPLFSEILKTKIQEQCVQSHHKITVLDAPSSLLEHMLWCDIAISASGLTKYELAATGTPTILFSIDKQHDLANQAFAYLGSVLDLGTNLTPQTVAQAFRDLYTSFEMRQELSRIGQTIIDGKGALRLVSAIGKDNS